MRVVPGSVLAILLAGLPVFAVEISGTVLSEEGGVPLPGIQVGASRAAAAEGLAPDAAIPVEFKVQTDTSGRFVFNLDAGQPGMNRVHVFTNHHTVFNEMHDAVDARGTAPRRRDLDEPGVTAFDLTAGPATGLSFRVASARRTERVLMRDGVTTLGTDVWLSSRRAGMAWPVLLMRTPYGRGEPPRDFVENDYAVVIQSTRGREDSDGEDAVFDDDGWRTHQDGYDTVEWVAAKPWCRNGGVCTFGGSAPGVTQILAAGAAPPHLACAFVEVASADFYNDLTYPGGEFLKNLLETWLAGQGSASKLEEYWDHPNEDAYWEERDIERRIATVRTPILHVGGWYDIFTQGTLDAFRLLQEQGGPGARRNQKLVIGPWVHGNYLSPLQGDLIYPAQSLFLDYASLCLRWFDFWLKGMDTGILDDPHARAYVMGPGYPESSVAPGNFWRTSDSWPPPALPREYFLQPGGSLTTSPPASSGGDTTYTSDPANPVPTRGGNNLYDAIGRGPMDQRPVDARTDVVEWQTAPLTAPVETSGPIRFVLYAASDRTDTDWVVKLEDVYPSGATMLVTDLILKARHRVSLAREDLLTPGTVYRFDVALWDSSITFPAGHRIRVAIASSNYPRFEKNPQTGEPFKHETHQLTAVNRIQHSAAFPSRLVLSVTDPAALQGCRPTASVANLEMDRIDGGTVRLIWSASSDPCHVRYRVFAGVAGPQWPWIVRRPVVETTATIVDVADDGVFWQVVSEGTDGGNGPHGSP